MARRLLDGAVMSKARCVKAKARGFTLVELSVVVSIVAILAVIGVVGYRKMINTSKVTEGKNVVSAIKVAQEHYKAEKGVYLNIGAGTLCPTDGTVAAKGDPLKKTQWDNTTCASGAWKALPVHVDGPVTFGYATCAGVGTTVADCGASWVTGWNNSGGKPWYTVYAQADLNADKDLLTQLASGSGTNQIFVRNEGD